MRSTTAVLFFTGSAALFCISGWTSRSVASWAARDTTPSDAPAVANVSGASAPQGGTPVLPLDRATLTDGSMTSERKHLELDRAIPWSKASRSAELPLDDSNPWTGGTIQRRPGLSVERQSPWETAPEPKRSKLSVDRSSPYVRVANGLDRTDPWNAETTYPTHRSLPLEPSNPWIVETAR